MTRADRARYNWVQLVAVLSSTFENQATGIEAEWRKRSGGSVPREPGSRRRGARTTDPTEDDANHRIGAGEQRRGDGEAERFGVPHFLQTQYLRTKGIRSQSPNVIVSSVSFVSTTNTARSLAGFVLLALALTLAKYRGVRPAAGPRQKTTPAPHTTKSGYRLMWPPLRGLDAAETRADDDDLHPFIRHVVLALSISWSPIVSVERWLSEAIQLLNHRIGAGEQRRGDGEAERFGVPHFLQTQYLRTKGIRSQSPNVIVSSVSFVSTTNTARSLAGFVLLALALTLAKYRACGQRLDRARRRLRHRTRQNRAIG